jgi:polyhydroxybutyrate depolymerase
LGGITARGTARLFAIIFIPVIALGCGSGAAATGTATSAAPTPALQTATPAATATPIATASATLPDWTGTSPCDLGPGDTYVSFVAAGRDRKALVHRPANAAAVEVPAIVALHGYSAQVDAFATSYTHFSDASDRDGFLAVYPQGLGSPPEWHIDAPSLSPELAPSDRAFISAVVDWLVGATCVNPKSVFLVGHSQGGGMASEMSCELSTRIAGLGLISAVSLHEPCKLAKPVPLVALHALDDPVLPYAGGQVGGAPPGYPEQLPIEDVMAHWSANYGCKGAATSTPIDGATQLDWQGCSAPIRFLRVATGGHDWAAATNDRLWEFFAGLMNPS